MKLAMKRLVTLTVVSFVPVAGCQGIFAPWEIPEKVYEQTYRWSDVTTDTAGWSTPWYGGLYESSWKLSLIEGREDQFAKISIYTSTSDWIFAHSVWWQGIKMPILGNVTRRVGNCDGSGCRVHESFSIPFPVEGLRTLSDCDFSMLLLKVEGTDGSTYVRIPNSTLRGFLSKSRGLGANIPRARIVCGKKDSVE